MIKILFVFYLLLLTLDGRENPFFPSVGEKDIPFTSNQERSKAPLKRVAIALPAQARVLQKVTIEYKNLDGSLESKSIDVDNYVDWHLPIFISQNYTNESVSASPTSSAAPSSSQNKNIQKELKYENIASIEFLKIYASGKSLKLTTKDEMIRNFLLVNPHRIVIDFKRDAQLKSYINKMSKNIFTEVRIGNHKGYYRAVIELDGYYRYSINKTSDGFLLELR